MPRYRTHTRLDNTCALDAFEDDLTYDPHSFDTVLTTRMATWMLSDLRREYPELTFTTVTSTGRPKRTDGTWHDYSANRKQRLWATADWRHV